MVCSLHSGDNLALHVCHNTTLQHWRTIVGWGPFNTTQPVSTWWEALQEMLHIGTVITLLQTVEHKCTSHLCNRRDVLCLRRNLHMPHAVPANWLGNAAEMHNLPRICTARKDGQAVMMTTACGAIRKGSQQHALLAAWLDRMQLKGEKVTQDRITLNTASSRHILP